MTDMRIVKGVNGPFRVSKENMQPGMELLIPSTVDLSIQSVISEGIVMHFIMDASGKDAFGHGFKMRDDAELILSEIRAGWQIVASAPAPAAPVNDATPKVTKRGNSFVITLNGNAIELPNGAVNKFKTDVEAYTVLLSANKG